jgi:hypothetical protein
VRAAARFHRAAGISTMAASLPGRGTGRAASRGPANRSRNPEVPGPR